MKPFSSRHGAAALACMLVLGTTTCGVNAEVVSFTFAGSLTQDAFGLSHFGAPVSGSYSFDSLAIDDIADPGTGSYTSIGPGFGFSVVVDGTPYATFGALNIGIQAGMPGAYLVTGVGGGLTLELVLLDDTGSAVAGDALPLLAPSLSGFSVREFRLFAPDAEFTATLQQLQGSAAGVPEPDTAVLLLAGLTTLLARRRRPRRRDAS